MGSPIVRGWRLCFESGGKYSYLSHQSITKEANCHVFRNSSFINVSIYATCIHRRKEKKNMVIENYMLDLIVAASRNWSLLHRRGARAHAGTRHGPGHGEEALAETE